MKAYMFLDNFSFRTNSGNENRAKPKHNGGANVLVITGIIKFYSAAKSSEISP